MRDFSLKARFSFRSLPEITESISVSFAKIKSRRPGIEGRISREIVFNAIFLQFASLSVDEQLKIYDSGLSLLVPLLAVPDPADIPLDSDRVDVVVEDVSDSTSPPPTGSNSKRRR